MLYYDGGASTTSATNNYIVRVYCCDAYDPYQVFDMDWLPPFTMTPAPKIYRPKFTKPQYAPPATAPRKALRCNRKGIGLRIKARC